MPADAARPRRRSWFQRSVISLNAVACVTCLVLGGLLTWSWQRVREIPRIELGDELAIGAGQDAAAGSARNVLIVGTDSADGLPEDDPVHIGRDAGVRTDTIMLLRVDPAAEHASLLSLPRDLYVPIAGTRGTARINAAIQGGPAQLVATVTDALDLPVHHYVEINFAGFRDLVAAIGGVPVYFPEPVRDTRSGLHVPEAGCITLDPDQALAFARSRAYEVFRGQRWEVDGSGDLGRIARQQDFIRRALHRAFQQGARNPTVLAALIEDGTAALSLDSTLTIGQLVEIGQRFRTFDPNELVTLNLPVYDAVADGAQVLRLDSTAAQPVLDVFRGADPTRVAPDNTVVEVRNGTPAVAVGAEAAVALRALDFVVPPDNVGDADETDVAHTVVRYGEDSSQAALLLASALNTDPVLEQVGSRELVGADVALVVGSDWPGVGAALRPVDPALLGDAEVTTSTPPEGPTSTSSSTSTSTSTTVAGEVPPAPPAGSGC